jgi:hypothetical protein
VKQKIKTQNKRENGDNYQREKTIKQKSEKRVEW